jgi:hypothetical protein
MNKIPNDKLLHFFWGAISAFPLIYLFSIYGFIFSLTLYGAKEIIYDWRMGKGNPEFLDFVYSSVPAIFYLILKLNL